MTQSNDILRPDTQPVGDDPVNHALIPVNAIAQILWHRRWTIAMCIGVCLIVAFVYLLLATPIYRANSRIYAEQIGRRIVGEGDVVRPTSNLLTQREVITSTHIIRLALENPSLAALTTLAETQDRIGMIKKGLRVSVNKDDETITVMFDSTSAADAKVIVEAIIAAYVEFNAQQRRSLTGDLLNTLRAERDRKEQELLAKKNRLIELKRQSGLLPGENDRDNPVLRQLSVLAASVTNAQLETIAARSAFEEAARRINPADPQAVEAMLESRRTITKPTPALDLATLSRELYDAQQLLHQLRLRYMEGHPSIASVQARIDHLSLLYVDTLLQVFRSAQRREADLRQALEAQQQLAFELNARAAESAMLEAEIVRLTRIADELDTRMKELDVTSDLPALNVTILEPARVAAAPVRPRKLTTLFQAIVIGLILGSTIAMIDRRFRSADEVKAALAMPLLGVIPHVPALQTDEQPSGRKMVGSLFAVFPAAVARTLRRWVRVARVAWRRGIRRKSVGSDTDELGEGIILAGHGAFHPGDTPMIESPAAMKPPPTGGWLRTLENSWDAARHTVQRGVQTAQAMLLGIVPQMTQYAVTRSRARLVELDPQSEHAEAYRNLRASVLYRLHQEPSKILLVTSPAPGDGKTTVATNLAIALAQAAHRVLLIDCDFRRPTQHAIFDLDGERGLSSVLTGKLPVEACITGTSVNRLDVLPCGPQPANPSELIGQTTMKQLLHSMSFRYDFILLDSPPILVASDTRMLGALADRTILVVRAEKSVRRSALHARSAMLDVGARFLGSVINDAPRPGRLDYSSYGLENYRYECRRNGVATTVEASASGRIAS